VQRHPEIPERTGRENPADSQRTAGGRTQAGRWQQAERNGETGGRHPDSIPSRTAEETQNRNGDQERRHALTKRKIQETVRGIYMQQNRCRQVQAAGSKTQAGGGSSKRWQAVRCRRRPPRKIQAV